MSGGGTSSNQPSFFTDKNGVLEQGTADGVDRGRLVGGEEAKGAW